MTASARRASAYYVEWHLREAWREWMFADTQLLNIVRNTCRTPNAAPDTPSFAVTTTAGTRQQRVMALVRAITPQTESLIPIQPRLSISQFW
jgi:hypothetical protein